MKIKHRISFLMVLIMLLLITACRETPFSPTEGTSPDLQRTETPVPSETSVPTIKPSETERPTRTVTNTPEPTSVPTIPAIREFLSDTNRIAKVYPESVEIIVAEESEIMPNAALGIAFDLPVMYALDSRTEALEGSWELIGGGLLDDRLLNISIGIFPKENAPNQADVESWYGTNPAGSLSTSEETILYDDGFGVLFTELYQYKGHFGVDVVYTVVLDYDAESKVGIGYFLSEEVFEENEIESATAAGIELVKVVQESFQLFEPNMGVLASSEFRIQTGICPTESDESYGYTQENPIRMTRLIDDPLTSAFLGPVLASQYLETLLQDGQPIQYTRLGSIQLEETILDEYLITFTNGETVSLFIDQYSSAPYQVPAGFGCVGILNPEFLREFEEE